MLIEPREYARKMEMDIIFAKMEKLYRFVGGNTK
jgi:hypothetical protein